MQDKTFMQHAIELALKGTKEKTHPNPRVGAVIIDQRGEVIGEGFHQKYGDDHAEVMAINSVKDLSKLDGSTIYVTLEPCSHFGKTPPCADLIIEHKIARVVIGSQDPNPKVSGQGIEKLKIAGIEVICGVMDEECRAINPEFFIFHNQQRPYIILKWAESADGYLDIVRQRGTRPVWMTGTKAKGMVHAWRAQCDAILVGRRTVEMDDPSLTVRETEGENPLRVVLDRQLQLNPLHSVFDAEAPTLIFTENISKVSHSATCAIDYKKEVLPQIVKELHRRSIHTLFVEGGAQTLTSFIENHLWDEARIFKAEKPILEYYSRTYSAQGIKAPLISGQEVMRDDELGLRIVYHKK